MPDPGPCRKSPSTLPSAETRTLEDWQALRPKLRRLFAYLDPSTGSMVVSAIVGIFASIALAVKTYWYKIKGFFRRDRKAESGTRERPE